MAGTTDERPAWLTTDFPELRDGPPWVMQEMVDLEPDLPAAIDGAESQASATAALILGAANRGEPIVISGCGTSEHGAMAVAELLDDALRAKGYRGGLVETRQAFEAALDPRPGGIFLAISHEGGTRATNLALEAAADAGAATAIITARGDSAGAAAAGHVILTPLVDRSWCHTVAYMSAILAGGMIAAAIEERRSDQAALAGYLRAAHGQHAEAAAIASRLQASNRILTAGSGADRASARELALKIEEGVRTAATERDLETLLHGHLAAAGPDTGLVLFLTDPRSSGRRDRRARLAVEACRRLGMPVSAIVSAEADASLPPETVNAGRIVLPANPSGVSPLLASLAGSAMALQLLTLALIQAAGTNPDLIRREEAPYREAAQIAEGSGDW